jgi:hypothetical protein
LYFDISSFPKLKHCKLWDLNVTSDDWKSLIKWSRHLETLYIWNLVITDADLAEIMADNDLPDLQDFRVGSSEIGFVFTCIL